MRLVADDGDFCFRDFQPHQAVIGVEEQKDFQIRGIDLETFVGLAISAGGAGGLHGDRTGRQLLGNDHRKSLHAALGPVVDARENSVLMIEIVVEDGDERSIEGSRTRCLCHRYDGGLGPGAGCLGRGSATINGRVLDAVADENGRVSIQHQEDGRAT